MPVSIDVRIAPGASLTQRTLELILTMHRSALPNLGSIAVLLPDQGACTQFRARLLQQLETRATPAVIPPWCGTLRELVTRHSRLPDRLISEHSRRLLFIEALQQHSRLFREENKWQVTLALLRLFDELNLQQISIDADPDAWQHSLQLGYGLSTPHPHLQQEAALVHTLWHAWHQQLEASRQADASLAHVRGLAQLAASQVPAYTHYYIASTSQYSNAELDFIGLLQQRGQCSVIELDDSLESDNPLWPFIQTTFAYATQPLIARARKATTPTQLPFSIFSAADTDTETRAIDIQVRYWLLHGRRNIGVICEDRKLSRRLRAVLERARVPLDDMAGWSLATTSAAAVLERWLECIETDFDYRAFLDVIKSHFVASENREHRLKNIYRLEHDIILHENIGHGLARYRKQLDYRQHRLPHWPSHSYDEIRQLLDKVQAVAAPMLAIYLSATKHPLSTYLDALSASLDALGIRQSFQHDAAGQCILQTLEDMHSSIDCANPRLHWQDFRNWLGMAFEEQLFSPPGDASTVQLMTLEQSALKQFDALVIAAADEQYLPGRAETSPFFNQGVRQSLGLPVWEQQRARRLRIFQQLLLAADEILITCKSHDNGEPVPLSPWIEALRVHAERVYAQDLANPLLEQLLSQAPGVRALEPAELPGIPVQPAPSAPAPLVPRELSASAHQRLVNCPYQYFAADILALKPSDEISEELQKSDYGNRVHQVLQAFHQPVANLPAPFDAPVSAQNRDAAIAHMVAISEQVFARDQQDNLLHRSWLHRWLDHVPAYIDWQVGQQQAWQVLATEKKIEHALDDALSIHGRLDRIDSNDEGQMIIDYKTGRTASQADVDAGEDVQLVSYAMLDDKASRVAYVSLDAPGSAVRTAAVLEAEGLDRLRQDCSQRLLEIYRLMRQQHPLNAWGDEDSCAWCNFRGLCRKDTWRKPAN